MPLTQTGLHRWGLGGSDGLHVLEPYLWKEDQSEWMLVCVLPCVTPTALDLGQGTRQSQVNRRAQVLHLEGLWSNVGFLRQAHTTQRAETPPS